MKSQAQESEDGVLSEEERLQLLTRAGQRNRLFILALGGVLGSLMLLSVGLNLYGLFSAGDEPRIQALEQQVPGTVLTLQASLDDPAAPQALIDAAATPTADHCANSAPTR